MQRPAHTLQLIGAKSTLLHLPRAQVGADLALPDFPVITLHSVPMCLSMRILGSCPGGIATGLLHNGPFGNQYEVTDVVEDDTYNSVRRGYACSRHTLGTCEQ